jgi:hypothetical protein
MPAHSTCVCFASCPPLPPLPRLQPIPFNLADRDLKAANLLGFLFFYFCFHNLTDLFAVSDQYICKVGDFSISRLLKDSDLQQHMTIAVGYFFLVVVYVFVFFTLECALQTGTPLW